MTRETAMMLPLEGSRLEAFARCARERHGIDARDYWALHRWSVAHPEQFWGLVWETSDLVVDRAPDAVVEGRMPAAQWFTGARLNYVDQVLRHRDRPGDAIVAIDEDGHRVALSWPDLADQVGAMAATLRRLGVGVGDRVVGYLPNGPEAVVAFLGAASLGAVWAGCAPDYGVTTASARFAQLAPAVLVGATGYTWAGTVHDRRAELAGLAAALGVGAVVEVERCGLSCADDAFGETTRVTWADAVARTDEQVAPVPVDAGHPLWVLFSSGTTGVPKGIVHAHGGIVAAHLAMLRLQHDLGEDGTLFWYTTPNWMMWNIVVSCLLVGATTVTYEGSPVHPDPDRLWRIVADERVTMFGTSPGHLQLSAGARLEPGTQHDLSALRQIPVTGAPVPAALNAWVRSAVRADVPVLSVCGGTDVCSAFLGSAPGLPVVDGELSAPLLGVAATTFDERGHEVTGEVGELVVTAPYPSMPVGFWGDTDGTRYRDAYFSTFPGVWRQGDWASRSERGSFVVHGRSDSTLNRNGVRFGSAELYAVVEADPAVAEALVLGVELADGGYRMPMFLVPAPGQAVDDAVLDRLRLALRTQGSPRHVPDEFHVVEALPHTRTGKKLEVPLKRILQGADPDAVLDRGAVDRPDLVDGYVRLAAEWAAR